MPETMHRANAIDLGIFLQTLMPKEPTMQESLTLLVEIAEKARREGILAIEGMLGEIDDEFLKNGIRLAVDGTDPEKYMARWTYVRIYEPVKYCY